MAAHRYLALIPGHLAELSVDELDETASAPLVPGREAEVDRNGTESVGTLLTGRG
jgi:hypothetical protein